ncbi:Hemicentin-1 [Portunus trituberculatus]|uniref:Hemicentin-1 n=1 Tax=Portunus trituberculatus TaxID=210409 RepID=A0A5B7CHC3_PORTR|nr:Hemicentin-1 [Portunus trituberculatus]
MYISDTDIDECEERLSGCHYTQICTNTWGSYVCSCAQGFRSAGPGQPCLDIDECKLRDRCQHQCHNTHGSYVCLCPPGYRLNHNQRTCDDIDECIEQSVKCGVEEVCFNQRGSYRCVAMRCPPGYQRDLPTG